MQHLYCTNIVMCVDILQRRKKNSRNNIKEEEEVDDELQFDECNSNIEAKFKCHNTIMRIAIKKKKTILGLMSHYSEDICTCMFACVIANKSKRLNNLMPISKNKANI